MPKTRLDVALVEQGFAESREKAKAIIMSGIVFVNNQKSDKAGNTVKPDDVIEVRGKTLKYVSRGGLKLEKAMQVFPINLENTVCADIGASTGGFTDCMLQNDAKKVYAVDVGYGQLAWKLRSDDRVVNMERTNIRYIDFDLITDEIDFISIDVAFISLKLVLPVAFKLLKQTGELVALIKPQFEAGKEEVGKKGVVRDISIHRKVINEILEFSLETGFSVLNLEYSPIKGPEGNIEFLLYLKKDSDVATNIFESDVMEITEKSHTLGG